MLANVLCSYYTKAVHKQMLKNTAVINVLKNCCTSQQCPVAICNKVQSKSIWKDVGYIIPLIGNTEGCNLEEALL